GLRRHEVGADARFDAMLAQTHAARMKNWFDLPAFDSNGCLNVVVESPRGSRIKFVFQPDTNTFLAERMLGLGVTYPFDWGFICGTRAEDDDPVDAMVIEDVPTYPGV